MDASHLQRAAISPCELWQAMNVDVTAQKFHLRQCYNKQAKNLNDNC
jgi:hypothetical protein